MYECPKFKFQVSRDITLWLSIIVPGVSELIVGFTFGVKQSKNHANISRAVPMLGIYESEKHGAISPIIPVIFQS